MATQPRRGIGPDADRAAALKDFARRVRLAHERLDHQRLLDEYCDQEILVRFAWGVTVRGCDAFRGMLARAAAVSRIESFRLGKLTLGTCLFGYETWLDRRVSKTGDHYHANCLWVFRPDAALERVAQMEQYVQRLEVTTPKGARLVGEPARRWMLEQFGEVPA